MVHVFTFKTGPKHTFSSQEFAIADVTKFISSAFLSCNAVLKFSGLRLIHIYKATRFLHMLSEE